MADQYASLKAILNNDSTLTTALTGGVFDDADTGADGVTMSFAQDNNLVASGALKPFAFVSWSNRVPQLLNTAAARGVDRFVYVYLYDDRLNGYGTIESAAERVITLLTQKERSVNDAYSHVTRFVDGGPRFRADELFDAAGLYVRFVDTYGR